LHGEENKTAFVLWFIAAFNWLGLTLKSLSIELFKKTGTPPASFTISA